VRQTDFIIPQGKLLCEASCLKEHSTKNSCSRVQKYGLEELDDEVKLARLFFMGGKGKASATVTKWQMAHTNIVSMMPHSQHHMLLLENCCGRMW
jgi:hypothetical protein